MNLIEYEQSICDYWMTIRSNRFDSKSYLLLEKIVKKLENRTKEKYIIDNLKVIKDKDERN